MPDSGIRIRLRRTRDNAILYDSGGPVNNLTEMVLDADMSLANASGSYVEDYIVEGIFVQNGNPTNQPAVPQVRRVTVVAMGLHR